MCTRWPITQSSPMTVGCSGVRVDHAPSWMRRAGADDDAARGRRGAPPAARPSTPAPIAHVADDRGVGMHEGLGVDLRDEVTEGVEGHVGERRLTAVTAGRRARRRRPLAAHVDATRRLHDRRGRDRARAGRRARRRPRAPRARSSTVEPAAERVRGRPDAAHLQPARASAGVCERVPVHRHVLPIVEGVLDPGCLISSLSSIAILPGETAQPIHADDQLIPLPKPHAADRVQLDVGAHRLHRGERRDPASSRARTSPTTPPTTARDVRLDRGRDAEGQRARSGTAACGTAAARTRTDDARVGIAMNYCAGYIRQQENQQLGIPREIAARVLAAAARARRLRRLQHAHRPHQQAQPGRDARRGPAGSGMVWDRSEPVAAGRQTCTRAASRRSSPRSSRTSASPIAKFVGFVHHRLGVDAGRGDPLVRRHRQPGPAVPRRAPARRGRPTTSTRSATARSATSGRSSSRSCCSRSARCSRSTRASRSSSIPHELESPAVAFVVLGVAFVLEAFSLRTARREAASARVAATRGGASSAAPRAPSCPSCCSRTSAALVGLGLALIGRRPGCGRTGDAALRRDRQHRHRAAARRDRGRARRRDEEPAHRRGRRARANTPRSARRSRDGPEVGRIIHLRTLQLGPEELLVARASSTSTRVESSRARSGDRRGRGPDPGRGPHAPA